MPDRFSALRRGVVTAPFVDGDVLHDSQSGRLFVLNPSATKAIKALQCGDSEDEIVDQFIDTVRVDPKIVAQDLRAFIEGLDCADLLETEKPLVAVPSSPPRPPDQAATLDAVYRVGERLIRVVCHQSDIAYAFGQVADPCRVADATFFQTCLTLFRHEDIFYVLEDDRVVDRVADARSARWALVRELVGEGRGRPWRALLHASAVTTPSGCLLLCGESGAGKSTLLAGLVHAGFAFVADDIVLMEQKTGLIWPTPLAISIKKASWPLVEALFPELASAPIVCFGGRTMRYLRPESALLAEDTGYPLAGVLFVHYKKNAATKLDQLDVTQSLVLLGEGGSILPDTDDELSAFLESWRMTPAWSLTYGRLEDAVETLSVLTELSDTPAIAV